MTLKELCKAVNDALNDRPDGRRLRELRQRAEEIASLTGWAPGAIDRQGRFAKICMDLEGRMRSLHERNAQQELAELHDAMAGLREAVARHDHDLRPSSSNDYEDLP